MELLSEFFPILVFFGVFKWKGLMMATLAIIIAAFVQLISGKIRTGKYKKLQLASFVSLVVLGGIALSCRKEIFIKWKPTAIYWGLAMAFLSTHVWGKQSLLAKLAPDSIELPTKIWQFLSILWIIFLICMGSLNLYVVYHFDTNTWVNFKLFGTFGLTMVFVCLQAIVIYKFSAKA